MRNFLFLLILGFCSFSQGSVTLNGAGATFPYPLYSKWFYEFHQAHSDIFFNYQSIGSGGGIRQLTDKTIDFGASDSPMSDEQMKKAGRPIFHFPATLGAVVVVYHLPGIPDGLRFTGELIAEIFQGKIQKWSDPKILALNPQYEEALKKARDILIVHRSDGSGTTAVFSEYLSMRSSSWKEHLGTGSALRWPKGIGGRGNEGVAAFMKQLPGTIGYVEYSFAVKLQMTKVYLQNKKGQWSAPSETSIMKAAEMGTDLLPKDFRGSLLDLDAKDVYPISSFSFLLIDGSRMKEKISPMTAFLKWSYEKGQSYSMSLNYSPIPERLRVRVLKAYDDYLLALKGTSP